MHRNHYPRVQSKVIAPRMPRLVLLWVLVTLALPQRPWIGPASSPSTGPLTSLCRTCPQSCSL